MIVYNALHSSKAYFVYTVGVSELSSPRLQSYMKGNLCNCCASTQLEMHRHAGVISKLS